MSLLELIFVVVLAVPLQSAFVEDHLSSNEIVSGEDRCEGVCTQDSLNGKETENCNDLTEKAVICYFTNWAWYRDGQASFQPEDIDVSLCTHVIYAFVVLDNESLTIVSNDLKADLLNGFFKKVTDLKKKGLTVLVSIGGWVDSKYEKWGRMLNSAPTRKNFVKSVVQFLDKYNFDGLDLGYSYPGCPQGNMTAALPNAKTNYNLLLRELKTAFEGRYLLTVPTPGIKDYVDNCYDMAELCEIVDWVHLLLSYKHHSSKDKVTASHSSMCGYDWTVADTINHYLDKMKCPAKKLALGFPFYTLSYTMADPTPAKFGVSVSGPGLPGPFTKSEGFLAYYETCSMIKNGYHQDYNKVNGTYAWHDNQFLSYEGVVDVSRKSCLINEFNLKGAHIWTLDYDDFNDMCGCGKYPLLKTLNQRLRCLKGAPINCY